MKKFSYINYLALFSTTFAVGLAANNGINNLSARNEGYAREEAKLHLNKKVQSLCNAKFVGVSETSGRTVFIDKDDLNGESSVVVDWDYSLRGKHELMWYGKQEYERCVAEIGEAER